MTDTTTPTSLLSTHRGQLAVATILIMVLGALLGRSPDLVLGDGAVAAQVESNSTAIRATDLRVRVILTNVRTLCEAQHLSCIDVADLETP